MEDKERVILKNSVGLITNHWIKITTSKGGRQVIKLEDILCIKHRFRRKIITAFVWLFVGLLCILLIEGLVIGIPLVIGGVAFFIGYIEIEIETTKKIVKLDDVEFNKLKDGRIFIKTLENLISTEAKNSEL